MLTILQSYTWLHWKQKVAASLHLDSCYPKQDFRLKASSKNVHSEQLF